LAFARRQFELSQPQEDGQPLIAHLRFVQQKTGRVDEMIANAPPLPDGLQPLWGTFLELHDSRGSTGWGPMRITYADMDAFCRVTGAALKPWEIEVIRKTDGLWLSEFAPKPKGGG
jgi:hypothetical protein